MVAFQPDPEKETAFGDLGWRAKDTLAVDPPFDAYAKPEKVSSKAATGRIILTDEDLDSRNNPHRPNLSPEEWEKYQKTARTGAEVVKSANRAALISGNETVEKHRESTPEELAARQADVDAYWDWIEILNARQDVTPDERPTNYRFFKHPREL